MYVVIERFSCVGVISSTSVKTLSAGKNVVAPNGDIKAEIETKKRIHILAPLPHIVYGGSDICLCNLPCCGPFFSASWSFERSADAGAPLIDVCDSNFTTTMLLFSANRGDLSKG
jgi:hypothetical protein